MKRLAALVVLLVFMAIPAVAQRQDAEDCKDSPLLSRMNGCTIEGCDHRDVNEGKVLIGVNKFLDGAVDVWEYSCPDNISGIALTRNAENTLKTAGFGVVYSGKNDAGLPAITMRKGNVWINVDVTVEDTMTYFMQTIIRTTETEQLESMEAEIDKTGSCSIYGILFDKGKATIQPVSQHTLNEVAQLLKNHSTWKMQIEGHTDNAGTKTANVKLSQARADAVRAWLVSLGIDAARLTAKGFGDTKPVADNRSEEGRAKNRRIALVKF